MRRALWLCLALAWTSRVQARADFVLRGEGAGFADSTPVQPVGGNSGSTLGEQRRLALARALEIWGEALDSPIPIIVQATFPELSCTDRGAVLGQAYAWQYMRNLPGAADELYYASALADRIVGRDISEGAPDLAIELNASVDGACAEVAGRWYYGFDGATPSGDNDLIQVALHELAHGFGFSSSIDPATGESQFSNGIDVYTSHILDLDRSQHWDALTPSERVSSAANVRRLVFDGENAQALARGRLATGVPSLALSPLPAGVSLERAVSDVELATNPAKSPVSGPMVVASPTDACSGPLRNDVRGKVVLLEGGPDCHWQDGLAALAAGGAVGAVFLVSAPASSPAEPLDAYGYGSPVSVRAVTVAETTGVAINQAILHGTVTATLAGEADATLGTDAQGHPLLFASQPALQGSSLSHFDSIARPNLLMEAYVQGGSNHDVDITLAVLRDIGWRATCGDGTLDADEQCDLGSENSDAAGAACRSDCRMPGCGDGVQEANEGCDEGAANSDIQADACRTNCKPAGCGDGVMDADEVCDQGIGNSDTTPDTCRSDCTLARCGDGVVDMGESCDGSPDCSATCTTRAPTASEAGTSESSDAGSPQDAAAAAELPTSGRSVHAGCALARGGQGAASLGLVLLVLLRRRRRAAGCPRASALTPGS